MKPAHDTLHIAERLGDFLCGMGHGDDESYRHVDRGISNTVGEPIGCDSSLLLPSSPDALARVRSKDTCEPPSAATLGTYQKRYISQAAR